MRLGIDGIFTDFPAAGVSALKAVRGNWHLILAINFDAKNFFGPFHNFVLRNLG
jgi:hypothetical protein